MKKRKKLTPEEKEQRILARNIRQVLKAMGFQYLRTVGKNLTFGGQKGEIDAVYLYENIILVCEDTVTNKKLKDHIKKSHFFFTKIRENFDDFLSWLKKQYPDKFKPFENYSNSRYKLNFVYFHTTPIDSTERKPFSDIFFVDKKNLEYFKKISNALKRSGINELFKFLNLNLDDVGIPSSCSEEKDIETAVILPEETSGFKDIKLVSFLIDAESLMDCSYVLRKESWEEDVELYQRLISPTRVNKIRAFIADKKTTFVNNVILSLPPDIKLYKDGKETNIESLSEIENLRLKIPRKINTIGIIDGQHRIYAHYRGNDKLEPEIAKLRKNMHLLATGLIFPKTTKKQDRIKFEGELFLEINSNQKRVNTALLQHISALQNPYSSIGIARKILLRLNNRAPFLDLFQIYSFETKKIKTPSIIKWGLEDLVEINDKKDTLYKYWRNPQKKVLLETGKNIAKYDEIFEKYLDHCTNVIAQFFNAIKANFETDWTLDRSSKLLGVTAITGFLISLRMALGIYKKAGDFAFYNKKLKALSGEKFGKGSFRFISSHWHQFAEHIKTKCWKL